MGEVSHQVARQRESQIEEGHLQVDHVHMMISIPPKCSVPQAVGYIEGKSTLHIARNCDEQARDFVGQHLRARAYFVSTVGREQSVIGQYMRPDDQGRRRDQLQQPKTGAPFGPQGATEWHRHTALSGCHPQAVGFAGG